MVVEIPIKLDKSIKDGIISVPITFDCSICNEATGDCTLGGFEEIEFALKVESSAPKEAKHRAQAKGDLPLSYFVMPPPAM